MKKKLNLRGRKVKQLGVDFYPYNKEWVQARSRDKYCGVCPFCGHNFEQDEYMTLAITDKGNLAICKECTETLKVAVAIAGGLIRDFGKERAEKQLEKELKNEN